MEPGRRLSAVVGASVLGALVLGGCSSGGHPGMLMTGSPGPRPADACTMLTSDQVAEIVGTPGPYTGAHEDPAEDGSPVWGCTWGTRQSYADVRELTAAQFAALPKPDPTFVVTPLNGIGDRAYLTKVKDTGTDPEVSFETAGRYYSVEVTVDRYGYADGPNANREANAAELLAKILVPHLGR